MFGLIIILISLTSKNLQPQESTKLLHNKCNSYVTSHTISYIDNLYAPEPLIWMCTTETSRMWGKTSGSGHQLSVYLCKLLNPLNPIVHVHFWLHHTAFCPMAGTGWANSHPRWMTGFRKHYSHFVPTRAIRKTFFLGLVY